MNRRICQALTLSVAAALLSACGGSQAGSNPLANSGMANGRMTHVGSWIRPNTSSQNLAYMADGSEVDIYSFNGKQVGALKGFEGVQGLCSDSQGNVWVTYGESLLEYAHAGTIPIAQVYTPSAPYGCAVDPVTGDLAVTENGGQQGSNVAVFQDFYGTPEICTDPDFYDYYYCSYDDQGNLFVNGVRGSKYPLAELPSGSGSLQTITLDKKIEKLGGLQWDGEYLALGDSVAHVVYQLSVASGQATTQTTTHFKGWVGRFKFIEPFAIYNGVIVLTFSKRQTGFYEFPAGGGSIHRIPNVTGAKTISVAPTSRRR